MPVILSFATMRLILWVAIPNSARSSRLNLLGRRSFSIAMPVSTATLAMKNPNNDAYSASNCSSHSSFSFVLAPYSSIEKSASPRSDRERFTHLDRKLLPSCALQSEAKLGLGGESDSLARYDRSAYENRLLIDGRSTKRRARQESRPREAS